jgi:hypothetical protein
MERRKLFFIESKSFEVILYEGNSGLQLIERGKNRECNIMWGREGTKWFCSTMEEVVTFPLQKSYSKTIRENGTVFVLQKNHNDRGWFLTVTGYGGSRHKGHLVIPAGRDMWGWRGLAQVVSELVKPMNTSVKTQLPEYRRPQPRRDTGTFKDAVIQGRVDTALAGFERDSYGKFEGISNGSGENHVEIDLKIFLSVNPDGRWAVKWVGPSNEVTGPQQVQNKAQEFVSREGEKGKQKMGLSNDFRAGPAVTKPVVHKTWRPKTSSKPNLDPLTNSGVPEPSTGCVQSWKSLEAGVREISKGQSSGEGSIMGLSSCADGSPLTAAPACSSEAEDWFLQLRHGRTVRLPPEVVGSHVYRPEPFLPPCSVGEPLEIPANTISLVMEEDGSVRPLAETQVMGQTSATGESEMVVYEEDDSDTWENTSIGANGLLVESQGFDLEENPGQAGVELLEWDYEEAPLSVEPLAMVVEPPSPKSDLGVIPRGAKGKKPKSDWFLQNLTAVGEVLGASYIGFEDRVEKLLLDIEARRNKRHTGNQGNKKGPQPGQRLSRELKNLCSSINYEGSSVSQRSASRERALVTHQ